VVPRFLGRDPNLYVRARAYGTRSELAILRILMAVSGLLVPVAGRQRLQMAAGTRYVGLTL